MISSMQQGPTPNYWLVPRQALRAYTKRKPIGQCPTAASAFVAKSHGSGAAILAVGTNLTRGIAAFEQEMGDVGETISADQGPLGD
jgi:hypothetical protein